MVTISLNVATAQKSKFGKVTQEELSVTSHEAEPEAKAAILYQEGKHVIEYDQAKEQFMLTTEVYRKIKIYDASDASYANVDLLHYKSNKVKESVQGIKAVTYNLESNKVKESKLDKKDIFKEKVSKNRDKTKFALPNIKDGSIIEYKYKLVSPFIFQVDRWYFQYDIPCNETFYKIEYPEHYAYKANSTGALALNVEQSSKARNITFRFTRDVSNNPNLVKKKWFTEKVDYQGRVITITQSNTPAIKEEKYITSLNSFRSSIAFELESTSWPGQPYKLYTQNWNQIAKLLHEDKDFGKQLNKKHKTLNSIIDQAKNQDKPQALVNVYNHIQSKYNYNGRVGLSLDKGIESLLKTGEGSASEINLLLINTLRKVGIEVYPIVTKTRNSGVLNTTYPVLTDLNYVFAAAILDEKTIYLDATDKNIFAGQLPLRAINMQGVLLNDATGTEIQIKNPNKSSITKKIDVKIDDHHNLTCQSKAKYSGISANNYRRNYAVVKTNEEWMDKLESSNENFVYDSIEVTNDAKGSTLTTESYTLEGSSEVIGDKIYIDVLLGNGMNENPFLSEVREYPIFYPNKSSETIVITLDIPEGYQLESIPEKTVVSLPEKMGVLIFTPTTIADKLNLHYSFKISQPIISPVHYEAVKKFYDIAVAKSKEKIVLSKKI